MPRKSPAWLTFCMHPSSFPSLSQVARLGDEVGGGASNVSSSALFPGENPAERGYLDPNQCCARRVPSSLPDQEARDP
jgi:hypothetical protein